MTSAPDITITQRPHVVIRASAGSGKTYQLSNRYLDLLHRHAPPETILATTFTRKAAGEILERILRRLALAATDKAQLKLLAEGLHDEKLDKRAVDAMLVTLCRSLHRVTVSTIDSFFSRIATTFRHELKLPPNPQVVDDDDAMAAQVRAEAIEAMLGDADTQVLVDLLRRLHHDSAKRGVTQAIDEIVSGLYDVFRQTKPEHWNKIVPGEMLPRDEVVSLVARFERLAATAPDKNFAKAIQKAREAAQRGAWDVFLSGGLAAGVMANPAAPVFSRKPITDEQRAVYDPLIIHAKAALLSKLAAQTASTCELLARFDVHYTKLRDQRRLLLFSDLPHKLARELPAKGEDLLTEICFRLDAKVGHLLLDEFQDTSFDQWAVLRPFAEEVTSFADRSRTFFCVGDVKQAIYGWRGGRAEIFDAIEHDLPLPEDAQVSLAVSYRSSQVVLDAVNHLFKDLGGNAAWKPDCPHREEAAAWSARFEAHTASRNHPGYFEIVTSRAAASDPECGDEDSSALEGEEQALPQGHEEFVAAKIAELAKAAGGRSIGVLVATNKSASSLIHCLRKLGVDASAEGRTPIAGDPAVDVVLAALTFADHPGDTAAAFHVLNSPLAAILGLKSYDGDAHLAQVAHGIRARIAAEGVAPVIADWTRRLAPSCDERSALRLTQLVELAERFDPGADGTVRTRPFVRAARAASVEEPSQSQVRVMTIHKSKGLEFDIVVLPELRKCIGAIRGGTAVYVDRDDATDEVHAVYRGTNSATRSLSTQLEEAYRQEQVRRMRDDLCALYVAMTRPRHALHIVLQPLGRKKDGGLRSAGCSDMSYAAVVRHGFGVDVEHEDPAGGETLVSRGDPRWHTKLKAVEKTAAKPRAALAKPLLKLTSERASRRTWRQVAPSTLHGEGRVSIADLLAVAADEARQRGTLIHGWCQCIEWLGEGAVIPTDKALLDHAVTASHVPPDQRDWAATQVAGFRQMIGAPGVVAALAKPKPDGEEIELWRERPFALRIGGELLRGSFDRVTVFRRKGKVERATLIDFKTDRIGPGAAAAAALVERYRPQLLAYRTALAMMLGIDAKVIEAGLLFLATGEYRAV